MNKRMILIITSLFLVCLTASEIFSKPISRTAETLRLSIEKNTFSLGEKLFLSLKIDNAALLKPENLRCGYLKTYVSNNNKEYKEVVTNGGLQLDECEISLPLTEKFSTTRILLWNALAGNYGLNNPAALPKDNAEGYFVFSEPGNYFVKMRLGVIDEKIPTIESEPIQITITPSKEEDLEVWNKIKGKRHFAYFLQENDILSSDYEERSLLKKDIEQIADQYPKSFIGRQLKQGLEKFYISEAQRSKSLKKTNP